MAWPAPRRRLMLLWIGLALLGLGALSLAALLALSLHGLWLVRAARLRRQGRRLRVRRVRWLGNELFHLELVHPWRLPLPRFAPGQFLTLQGSPGGGRVVRRCYSLAAWHARPWHYELCIKREDEGLMTRWLAEHCRPGASLQALAPAGHFQLRHDQGPHLLLIAGGVGITPMRAMLHAWRRQPRGRRATLIYAGRDLAALAYHAEFLRLASQRDDFDYRPMLSRDSTVPPPWQGRLDRERLAACLDADSEVFICAGDALLQASRALLEELGVAESRVHYEAFGADALGAGQGSHALDWAGETLRYEGQPSLLHALHEQGIEVPADCWGGHCGSCRLSCAGQVQWRQQPAGALRPGEILACCCIPQEDLRLAPAH